MRPLLTRPGARFQCQGDGLCCADAHLLGPVSAREAKALRVLRPGCVVREHGMLGLRTKEDGTCTFLDAEGGCEIHAEPSRPRTCHRYPFALVATPDGGRVATDHRCPCRTLGDRPPLVPSAAEDALRDGAGKLSVDRRVELPIALSPTTMLDWAEWLTLESSLLARLASGERAEDVLDARAFPALPNETWTQVGASLADDDRPMRWTRAHQWAGLAILALHGEAEGPWLPPRPWSDAFDRAEARSPDVRDVEATWNDWIADAIYGLEWTFHGSFALARAELATRLAIARWIASALQSEGARSDRAAAEALAIVEIVGLADTWLDVIETIEP